MVLMTLRKLLAHPAIACSKAALERHRYSTPLFVLRETLAGFGQHNGFSISAALSFYALFALIPMVLLIFFLMSHLVVSSNSAIANLAMLTNNVLPKFSNRIMIEVFNISKHRAVWGVFGVFALLSATIPLASALRSSFHTIAAVTESLSFFRDKLKDLFVVLGILLLFFLFSVSGIMIERLMVFFHLRNAFPDIISFVASLAVSTLLLSVFYRAFFPRDVSFRHILSGSLLTAVLWMAMRPALGLFLSFNQSYGLIFGGLKNMFLSIGWLYYGVAVFLLGTELIATLRNKDILLLKGLFRGMPHDREVYLRKLIAYFGRNYGRGEKLFSENDHDHDLYYVVTGAVAVTRHGVLMREIGQDEYLGEMAFFTDALRSADATVISDAAEILVISKQNLETLLLEEPNIAMIFLKDLARRLKRTRPKAPVQPWEAMT
jgi:membrane protein